MVYLCGRTGHKMDMLPLKRFQYILDTNHTSPFNNKLGFFEDNIETSAFHNNLSFCWMGKLYGKPVTPFYLKS